MNEKTSGESAMTLTVPLLDASATKSRDTVEERSRQRLMFFPGDWVRALARAAVGARQDNGVFRKSWVLTLTEN